MTSNNSHNNFHANVSKSSAQECVPIVGSSEDPVVSPSLTLMKDPQHTDSVEMASIDQVENSSDWVDSLLPVPVSDVGKSSGANAFVQLVQGWENYINDDRLIDPFPNFQQPLQMLQDLSLCGHPAADFAGLKPGAQDFAALVHPLAPATLRHTHSSPSQISGRSSSILYNQNFPNQDACPPPPIALDPFQRSTSTPSAFRQHCNYSSFGTTGSSAFTSPRYSGFSSMGREASSYSAFGPVQFYSMALETMEQTSIEVQDISDRSRDDNDDSLLKQKVGSRRGAASRAAKFLSDVRVLRRRRRARGGRENPAQPASVSSSSKFGDEEIEDEHESSRPLDTAVTVVTETVFGPNDTSFLSGSSEMSALVKDSEQDAATDCEDDVRTNLEQKLTTGETKEAPSNDQQYLQLDSDVEEEIDYQRIETQLQSVSPTTPPSSYGFFAERKNVNKPNTVISHDGVPMRVQVSSSNKPRYTMAMETGSASPSPTRMERGGEGNSLTQFSLEPAATSPHTTRSSVTGSSSGHTTQATIASFNTGHQSGLSTISETDREVMQANKDAKRRRGLDSLTTARKTETDGSSNNSSSSTSTNPHRYFSLASSPVGLRDGANVPVERFFTESPNGLSRSVGHPVPLQMTHTGTSTSTTSRQSGSTTSESLPVTHTSSSTVSTNGELPPTFVSYIDREASSDLTSFRESMEPSSKRAAESDLEKREASPASEMMDYADMLFEEPTTSSNIRGARLDRFRSRQRPPRSPAKGARSAKTPPPHGSVSPLFHQQLSPPRTIVDRFDAEVSRPHVMRRSVTSINANSVISGSLVGAGDWRLSNPQDAKPIGVPVVRVGLAEPALHVNLNKHRTYQESSIEIMNSNTEDKSNVVTPEK
jgi:hypothetical protein